MNVRNIFRAKTDRRALGDIGERAAARYLRRHGYKIKKRGFIAADAEIDLICETRDTVVFVEVKTRTEGHSYTESRPAAAVTPEKQRKILRASKFYSPRPYVDKRRRFDIVEVYTNSHTPPRVTRICHMEGAFTYDTAYPKR